MHLGIRSHLLARDACEQHIAVEKGVARDMAFQVVVTKIQQEAERIKSFELHSVDGTPVPHYVAGSNITLQLANGLSRTYSLTDAGDEPDALRIAVLDQHGGRGGSRFMHANVNVGDTLTVKGIANSFSASDSAKKHILIAGGIGITPIISLSRFLSKCSSDFHVHYSARRRSCAAFMKDIIDSNLFAKFTFYFDDEMQRIDLRELLSEYVDGSVVYCCGPSGLMDAVSSLASHWPKGAVRLDSFEPLAESQVGAAFRIKVASTGQTFDVPPGQTILNILRHQGFDLGSQCEQGMCGACLTPVLEGVPEHRDRVLSESEKRANDLMTICCSRSLSDLLVLDL